MSGSRQMFDHFRDDRGATAVEYALMVALIATVIIVSVTALGVQTSGLFERFIAAWPG